jgi:tRNA(His) 5'-end guanylyltransferase
MKHYERAASQHLMRRCWTLFRVDGRAFHSYTRGCQRPFDRDLMEDMDQTAVALCEGISGARLAFVQSDEISVLMTDFETLHTEPWFDNDVQKIVSLSAAIATRAFNQRRTMRWLKGALEENDDGSRRDNHSTADLVERFEQQKGAEFDSRVWQVPEPMEVYNYFLWRQQDASRNSVSMTAQANFPHALLQGKDSSQMQEMLWRDKGINWNDLPVGYKRGRCVVRTTTTKDVTYQDKKTGEHHTVTGVERHQWSVVEPPVFSQQRDWLVSQIPVHGGRDKEA